MFERSALALALSLGSALLAWDVAAAGPEKAVDCAKPESVKRSECSKAGGQTHQNDRTNKSGAAKGADRSGAVQDLNAAREKSGGKK